MGCDAPGGAGLCQLDGPNIGLCGLQNGPSEASVSHYWFLEANKKQMKPVQGWAGGRAQITTHCAWALDPHFGSPSLKGPRD